MNTSEIDDNLQLPNLLPRHIFIYYMLYAWESLQECKGLSQITTHSSASESKNIHVIIFSLVFTSLVRHHLRFHTFNQFISCDTVSTFTHMFGYFRISLTWPQNFPGALFASLTCCFEVLPSVDTLTLRSSRWKISMSMVPFTSSSLMCTSQPITLGQVQ